MRNNKTRRQLIWLCQAAIIAALYVVLTYLAMAFGLDKNAVQIRFSEALIVLAYFTPAAIPGLYVGCLLANILTGCAALDILLGPIATLIGAVGAYLIGRMKNERLSRYLCTIPNIVANVVIVSFICTVCYTAPEARNASAFGFYALTVGIGEVISSGIMGTLLLLGAEKTIRRVLKTN
ncbi:MAG: QueT transporter family protein [Clostridia bacterium]|nr:QueT transporter family protein [Clostridia bacterium]